MAVEMERKLKRIEARSLTKVRDFKSVILQDAARFVKHKLESTTKALTAELHLIV